MVYLTKNWAKDRKGKIIICGHCGSFAYHYCYSYLVVKFCSVYNFLLKYWIDMGLFLVFLLCLSKLLRVNVADSMVMLCGSFQIKNQKKTLRPSKYCDRRWETVQGSPESSNQFFLKVKSDSSACSYFFSHFDCSILFSSSLHYFR